jgi:hypothetical protein
VSDSNAVESSRNGGMPLRCELIRSSPAPNQR